MIGLTRTVAYGTVLQMMGDGEELLIWYIYIRSGQATKSALWAARSMIQASLLRARAVLLVEPPMARGIN